MGSKAWFRLNTRRTVVIVITACMMVIGAVGLMSYNSLQRIERKTHLLAVAEDLSNTILETRRYEKNYFLFNQPQALDETIDYVEHGLRVLDKDLIFIKQLRAEAHRDFLRRMLSNIEQEVLRARDIVRSLLEFSRVKEFSPAPVALTDVVERSVRLISSQVPNDTTISRDIPDDLVVPVDSQRMQQVFLNPLMNAIQAIEHGPGTIIIHGRRDPSRQQAVITVEDNGSDIAEENPATIFDPFFFTTKELGAGTGLGLSIAYGIIEKHQGTITVESLVGEGTRFTIRPPLTPNSPGKNARQ